MKRKPATTVGGLFDPIDAFFKDVQTSPSERQPFLLLVAVAGRMDSPGPRDPMWEFLLDAGRDLIEPVLDRKPIGAGPHYFVFPDRWLTPPESADFTLALSQNPDAAKFGRVYCVVHQPYIVSGCRKENVRILTNKP